MTERIDTLAGPVGERSGAAYARLVCEFESLRRRLVGLARFKYRLALEDCEEIAADALLAWYQELCRRGSRAPDTRPTARRRRSPRSPPARAGT